MSDFFYRFDCLSLTPGNKTAGFLLALDTAVMVRLSRIPVTADDQERLRAQMQERLGNANLASDVACSRAGFMLLNDSACARYFFTDPAFGGSVGANPEELGWLARSDALEWLGPTMMMTPHNVDTASDALMLMVMVATWAEWAHGLLQRAEWAQPASEAVEVLRDNDGHRYRVPAGRVPEFRIALEHINDLPAGCADWREANEALHAQFGVYLEG